MFTTSSIPPDIEPGPLHSCPDMEKNGDISLNPLLSTNCCHHPCCVPMSCWILSPALPLSRSVVGRNPDHTLRPRQPDGTKNETCQDHQKHKSGSMGLGSSPIGERRVTDVHLNRTRGKTRSVVHQKKRFASDHGTCAVAMPGIAPAVTTCPTITVDTPMLLRHRALRR